MGCEIGQISGIEIVYLIEIICLMHNRLFNGDELFCDTDVMTVLYCGIQRVGDEYRLC
jgi:hypothetical protein